MSVDHSLLQPGLQVSRKTVTLDSKTVEAYLEAVGDRSPRLSRGGDQALAPPMAVAALGLRSVLEELAIPGGAVHAGQELTFDGAVPIGESLHCNATVVQNSVRRAWRFLVVQMEATDGGGRKVMSGKTTIMLPV